MSALGGHPYVKMNGAGNEILVIDLRGSAIAVSAAEARAVGRGEGLGFDQLMVLHDPVTPGTDAFMKIYNIDGSPAAACGNGTRCVAWSLLRGRDRTRLTLETEAGLLPCERQGASVFTVDMGVPRFAWNEIPLREPFADTRAIELQIGPIDAPILHTPSAVSMGNPHAIFWVADVDAYDLRRIGPLLENHPIFPARANISLAQVAAPDHLVLRVWERGAGLTKACGSAACAAAVAAARKGLAGRQLRVSLPGGELAIEWRADNHVLMTGPVEFESEGRLPAELFRDLAA
ncbi:MAG: diaminopimelate epimerase [Methylobacteriaceae bacterium]|nr:diaminopimelate epimerase [Methylobacteriaceae bacterium]